MPGVCPACGRDLRLEEIVASLPKPENEAKRKQRPLDWSECAWAAIAFCLLICGIAGFVWKDMRVEMGVYMFILGAPNFFLGFFTAGFSQLRTPGGWDSVASITLIQGGLALGGATIGWRCLLAIVSPWRKRRTGNWDLPLKAPRSGRET